MIKTTSSMLQRQILTNGNGEAGLGGPADGRRPYHAPRIIERQALESVAADCSLPGGKNDPTCIVGFS
jgi:hypothetical protein